MSDFVIVNTISTPWVRAILSSTAHRLRRGEGALLAINFSVIAGQASDVAQFSAGIAVSTFAMLAMYAFNDLYDAPADLNNPKKDQALISIYLNQPGTCAAFIFSLKLLTVLLALATLGPAIALAVTAVMLVNLSYSMIFKGVAVIDVLWCGLWGALFAAVAGATAQQLLLVGVMTAICHLFQALGDRIADAREGIVTTAVRSGWLARAVLWALCASLLATLGVQVGLLWGLTAVAPLLLFHLFDPQSGWLMTKIYFAAVWLRVLGVFDGFQG